MQLSVRLFGVAAEAAAAPNLLLEVADGSTVAQVRAALQARLGPLVGRCAIAVDRRLAAPVDTVAADAEVALLPPVSGGEGRIGPEPIDPTSLLAEVRDPDLGGAVLFLGTVRGRTDGAVVTARLHYEAYTEMASEVLEALAVQAAHLWPGARIAMRHRTGTLAPGDVAVGVAVARIRTAKPPEMMNNPPTKVMNCTYRWRLARISPPQCRARR